MHSTIIMRKVFRMWGLCVTYYNHLHTRRLWLRQKEVRFLEEISDDAHYWHLHRVVRMVEDNGVDYVTYWVIEGEFFNDENSKVSRE